MLKKIIIFISYLIISIDNVIYFFLKKNFRYYLYDTLRINSLTKILIKKKKIILFNPSHLSKWRVKTFYTKEPETLKWIESFKKDSKIIFWDIGANIGLYSVYVAINFPKSSIISFEPSTLNLNILSRNISLNNLEKKINIFQIGLTNINNKFFEMNETTLEEGGALSSFAKNYNFEGKKIRKINKYSIFGTKIDYLISNSILKVPDYIKIDVDGIEHFILQGGDFVLKHVKSILIEINDDFVEQSSICIDILKRHGFNLQSKNVSSLFSDDDSPFKHSCNQIWSR